MVRANPFNFFITAFVIFAASSFAIPLLFRANGLNAIPAMSAWTYLPTVHMGTFLLGVVVEQSRHHARRLAAVLALGFVYCLATYVYYPLNNILVPAATVLLVAFTTSIRLPYVVARFAGVISQASLLIYLLHIPLHSALKKMGQNPPLVDFLIAIGLTTVFALQFDKFYIRARDYLRLRNATFAMPSTDLEFSARPTS
jgi:surface polysaccharide O-acyltransferase-like enzyme